MSTHTVIRVKRRRNEAPLDALLVACKRQKCEENSSEDTVTTLVKLAGTFDKLDDSSLSTTLENVKAAKKLREDKLQHVSDVREKLRSDLAKKWKDQRYEVVNKFRSESLDGTVETPMNVLDVESKTGEVDDEDFLYDIYHTTDIFDGVMESLLSVQPVELVNDQLEGDAEDDNESEDSNDENNWRNDYPDEDDEKCFESADSDEDDNNFGWTNMRRKKSDDEDAYSLSSDDLDEDYVYGRSEHVDGLVERWHDALAPTDSEDDNDKSA